MSEQWQVTPDDADRWYYQRRTDPTGARVILELHLGVQPGTVAAALHVYDDPDGHDTDDLDGCVFRISVPALDVYEQWLLAGRDDATLVAHLAGVEVPVVAASVPQSHVDALEAENTALKAALKAMGGTADVTTPARRTPRHR